MSQRVKDAESKADEVVKDNVRLQAALAQSRERSQEDLLLVEADGSRVQEALAENWQDSA